MTDISPTIPPTTPSDLSLLGASSTESAFGLGKDGFLKILVEQMRHQDPNQPGDSQDSINQMTQFSMLEQLTNMATAMTEAQDDAAMTKAVGLIGRTATWLDAAGAKQSGLVESVQAGEDGPTLTVAGTAGVSTASLIEVK